MADPSDITSKLTKLQPAGQNNLFTLATPQLNSGTVALFQHPDWNSPRFDVSINEYRERYRHMLNRSAVDNTTWIAWNLPVGTVVTLSDHYREYDPNKSVGSLDGLGGTVDLVGTGSTESTDLRNCGMNDIIAAFFWRNVDLNYGAFEMFEHPDFTGIRTTIFLAEWAADTRHHLPGWHMNDNMTSVRWRGLTDRQTVTLYEHPEGGRTYDRLVGYGNTKEERYLPDVDFDDKVSAFSWTPVLPMKEVLEPIEFKINNSSAQTISSKAQYRNTSGTEQKFTPTLERTLGQSFRVESMDQHVAKVTTTLSQSASVGVPGVADFETTFSLELGYEYTKSTTKETTQTTETKMTYSQEVTAQPGGTTTATMLVTISDLPATQAQTWATRWYKEPITGAERDDSNNGWYRRVEPAWIVMKGGLASTVGINVDFQPF